jgi:hypothetical protein
MLTYPLAAEPLGGSDPVAVQVMEAVFPALMVFVGFVPRTGTPLTSNTQLFLLSTALELPAFSRSTVHFDLVFPEEVQVAPVAVTWSGVVVEVKLAVEVVEVVVLPPEVPPPSTISPENGFPEVKVFSRPKNIPAMATAATRVIAMRIMLASTGETPRRGLRASCNLVTVQHARFEVLKSNESCIWFSTYSTLFWETCSGPCVSSSP